MWFSVFVKGGLSQVSLVAVNRGQLGSADHNGRVGRGHRCRLQAIATIGMCLTSSAFGQRLARCIGSSAQTAGRIG
jgi:hypothetical protein